MSDLRVTAADLAGTETIYLRIDKTRYAFDPVGLRALVKERAVMCGWPRDDDGWWIPDHIVKWYADRQKVGDQVITRANYRRFMWEAVADWLEEYGS